MDTLHEWISPTIEFAILFTCGALGGVGGMFSAGKAITLAALGDAIFRGGAFGGGAGIVALEKITRPFAIAVAIFVGGGWLTKEQIINKLFAVFQPNPKDRNDPIPPKPND